MSTAHFKFKWFLRGMIFAVAFVALFSLFVMLLWNWLMPAIFGLARITYLQSAGLLVLSKIIFSGFGKRGGPSLHDKKEFFRKKFEERCGHFQDESKPDNEAAV